MKALVQEAAQTYEQPEAVVRWHYEKPERLSDFEALAVEHNVVDVGARPRAGRGQAGRVRRADGDEPTVAPLPMTGAAGGRGSRGRRSGQLVADTSCAAPESRTSTWISPPPVAVARSAPQSALQ